MKNETYDFLWDHIIHPCIQDIIREYSEKGYMLTEKKNLKSRILKAYNNSKNQVKKKYYPSDKQIAEIRIDKHKIAACFTEAFLKVKACTYDIGNEDVVRDVGLVNYKIAFNVGIGIIYVTLLSYYDLIGNTNCFDTLKEWNNLKFPLTTPGHDSYKKGRIKTLALNDLGGIAFDILTYADMLFWIELYNRQLLENKINVVYQNVNTAR